MLGWYCCCFLLLPINFIAFYIFVVEEIYFSSIFVGFLFFYLMLYVPTYKHIRNVKECRKAKQTLFLVLWFVAVAENASKKSPKLISYLRKSNNNLQGKKEENKNRQKKGSEKFYLFLLLFSKS